MERETKTPTVDGTTERRGSVSLHHLLTDNLTNSGQFRRCVFFCTALCLLCYASVFVLEPDRYHLTDIRPIYCSWHAQIEDVRRVRVFLILMQEVSDSL